MRMTPSTRRWALLEDWWPLLGSLREAAWGCAHGSCGVALLALCTLLSASWLCCGLFSLFITVHETLWRVICLRCDR